MMRKDSLRPLASDVSTSKDSGYPADDLPTCVSPAPFTFSNGAASIPSKRTYPFPLVLRLRVLQIVCGISALVMGAVAVIEERGEINLGLGIPAGGASVLAAAASVHTSRGFSGYRASAVSSGPSGGGGCGAWRCWGWWWRAGAGAGAWRGAALLFVLWAAAVGLHAALLGRALLALAEPYHPQYPSHAWVPPSAGSRPSPTRTVLAAVQMTLAFATLVAVILVLHIDCRHDPGSGDGPGYGGGGGTTGGTSSTAVSMVAVASTSSERASRV